MKLYTFIMEYKGGTYINQVRALHLNEAREKWAEEINISEIQYFGAKAKKQLIDEMRDKDTEPVLLDSLKNAWCTAALINGSLAIINIIKTSDES